MFRLTTRRLQSVRTARKISEYSKLGPGHVFQIKIDDLSLKMTFRNHRIGSSIVERIEGRREPITMAIIRSLLRPGDRVLELGGCYGYFTSIMSQCVGPDGKVVSIEGTPNNYRILLENIQLNNLSNVVAYNYFIAGQSQQVWFKPDENHPYGAIDRLQRLDNSPSMDAVVVPSGSLSRLLDEIQFRPDYVFMDIEGFEVYVLEDILSAGYLDTNRPVIVFEIHEHFYKVPKDLAFIKDTLKRSRYQYREVQGNLICFPEAI